MYASDVKLLIEVESSGEPVISWFAQEVWNLRKGSVNSAETGLRLSKLLRDNRHTYMSLLKSILDAGHHTFLASLLSLDAADFDPEFKNLIAVNHLTQFDALIRNARTTKYAAEQKARRIRISFSSLMEYHKKENRSAFVISNEQSVSEISKGMHALQKLKLSTSSLDRKIGLIVSEEGVSESDLRALASMLPEIISENQSQIKIIRSNFVQGMKAVGRELSELWDTERYVRLTPGEIIE